MGDDRPIGVFDSGIGGLSVLSALRRALPDRPFLYLGDTARLPYGTKSPATVTHYAVQAARVLVARGISRLVVACNTASAVALGPLTEAFSPLPVVGVVEPGARAGLAASRSRRIAVIATESTVRGGAYRRAITRLDPLAEVREAACPLFVALAEEGWTTGPVAAAAAARYLAPLFAGPAEDRPDTLILGCTHFPALADVIAAAVPGDVRIVDSAATTAAAVAASLAGGAAGPGPGGTRFLVTDGPERFCRVGPLFLGAPIPPEAVELIDSTLGTGH